MSRSLRAPVVLVGLLSLVVATSPVAAASSTNLLTNPGFEQPLAGHSWMPASWDTFQAGLNTVFFGRDTFLVHGGSYAVNVANVSTLIPMWHNWSQTIPIRRELWGKDLTFSVWTRSNGLQGRAYILLQAYRDTIQKEAWRWGVSRDTAATRMGITKTGDPLVMLGFARDYFSDPETEWVKREVRVFVPASVNCVVVRCGLLGTGQVLFDDASLTAEDARPAPTLALNTNLLKDPSFEGDGNDWEYSMPPYEGMRVERDSSSAQDGRMSIAMGGGLQGWVQSRAGVCQQVANRNLGGKRIRLTGWIKGDSLQGLAYLKVYCNTPNGDTQEPTPRQFSGTFPWTKAEMVIDTPPVTYGVWGWFLYNAPAKGSVSYDNVSMEILGPASYLKSDKSDAAAKTQAAPPK